MSDNPPQFEVPADKKWEVRIEDWKMSKDRIDAFDKAVITIRMGGIPIVFLIIGVGFAFLDKAKTITIPIINCNGAALPFIFAGLYTIPLFLLDFVHYRLLLKAIEHAIKIENSESFKDLLGITKALTTRRMTSIHTWSMIALYGMMFILSIALIRIFW